MSQPRLRFLGPLAAFAASVPLLLAVPSAGRTGQAPPVPTRSYSLYVGFAAQMDCKPKDGPYLTKLSHDVHVPLVRFVFEKRRYAGLKTDWHPLLGSGPEPRVPWLVFDQTGHMQAELCPYIECDKKIQKAWFTKRNDQFRALFQVVSMEEKPDIMGEIINRGTTGDLKSDLVSLAPYVLYVHFIAAGKYAWTGECIVRHQDCGATSDLAFYLALPADRLEKGEEVSLEFPFENDDFDVPGVLTVRFIPTGSIKGN